MRIGIALLAAGVSRRFGDQDKLAVVFCGGPLGAHVCAQIPQHRFSHRWVIASDHDHPCAYAWRKAGFKIAVNDRASEGMGTSVALSASLAVEAGCDALAIALADMPLVPREHFENLADTMLTLGMCGMVVSSTEGARMPPAIFGEAHLERLSQLAGDVGARAILSEGEIVECPPEWLVDIDTPDALKALR